MKIEYEDEDLKELIETGQNKKYKKIAKNKVLMGGLLKDWKEQIRTRKANRSHWKCTSYYYA